MKQLLALFILSIAVSSAFAGFADFAEFQEAFEAGWKIKPHSFGAIHLKRETPEGTESIVHLPSGGLFSEPEHHEELQAAYLYKQNNMDQFMEDHNNALLSCEDEGRPDYLKVIPMYIGNLNPTNNTVSYTAPCFLNNTITLTIKDNQTAEILHVASNPKNLTCTDSYFYTTIQNFHVDTILRSGQHTITLKLNSTEVEQIQTTGLFVFRACDKATDFIPDLLKTMYLFLGGLGVSPYIPFWGSKPTPEQIKNNIKFIYEATGYQWQQRPQDVVIDLDESLFQSGDFLAITRFDGLDQIIEYGAGTHAGHSVMIIKVDGETYVVESQAAWYWPRKNIQINPYKQWIKWARDADFMVTWLPLKKEVAAKFNSTAALEWFRGIEGTPYGFHNFLFGWIDTPDHSFPPMLAPEFLGAVFAIVESVDPAAAAQVFTLALNMRLNTTNLTVAECAEEAYKRGLTLPDLYAMVEPDEYYYPDGRSYVCSSFVIAMWKAGGLFDGFTVNAVEFTPRDLYQLVLLDPNPVVPENCKQVDPTNPYCQIMGLYRMEFPGISTIEPYSHMNEHCWSEPPNYERFPNQC